MPDGFTLVVVKGSEAGKEYSFAQDSVTIGRTAGNDLTLSDASVSSRHARITVQDGTYYLQDLGSTNKTFLGSRQVEEGTKVHLKHEDEFSLGNVVVRFLEEEDTGTKVIGAGPKKDVLKDVGSKLGINQEFLQRNKRLVIVAAAVVVLLLLLSLVKTCSRSSEPARQAQGPALKDKSLEVIPLPALQVYGNCRPDRTHPDKALFTFTAQSAGVDLYYQVGGVDSDGEVIILLNDTKIANAPLAMKGWSGEQVIHLPRNLVREGEENTLAFDNTFNPPDAREWGVKEVRVEFLATGTCNEDEGRKLLELGDEMYEQKAVSEGNIYRAWKYYVDAIEQVEGCHPEPFMLAEMERKMRLAKEEVETRYNDLVFSYKQAVKLNKYSEAKSHLEKIVQLIPDPKDDRHEEAVRLLKKITDYLRARGG